MANKPAKKVALKQKERKDPWTYVTGNPRVFVIFILVAFLIYGQVMWFFLGKMDEDIILNNLELLRNLSNVRQAFLRDAFFSDAGRYFYRPLQNLSFMIDAQFFQERGSVCYFTNLLIHAATCCSLFYLLTLAGNSRKTSFLFTMLFLCSPLFVQAIAWAPSRGDMLIGLAGILTMVFFIRLTATRKYKYAVFALLAFTAAMFSKETAILIPVVVLAGFLLLTKDRKALMPQVAVVFGGFLLIILLYLYARSKVVRLPAPAADFGLIPLLHNLRTLPEFLAKFLFPFRLSPMPGFTLLNTLLGVMVFLLLTGLFIRYSKQSPGGVLFGVAWFLIFTIPGLMYHHRLGNAAYDYLEHRSYLPLAGIVLSMAFLCTGIPAGRVKDRVGTFLLFFAFALGIYAYVYAGNYRNPMAYYERAITSNPASAFALESRGQLRAGTQDFTGAITDYDRALAIRPDFAEVYVNKGSALSSLKDYSGAIARYDSALLYEPGLFLAYFNKANALAASGRHGESVTEYTRAARLMPGYTPCYTARGIAYFRLNDMQKAEQDFSKAITLDSVNAVAYLNRGKIRFNAKDVNGACSDWLKAAGLGEREAEDLRQRYCR